MSNKQVKITTEKPKRTFRGRLIRWLIFGTLGCCGLIFILQTIGILPDAEEIDATNTAEAAVAQAATETAFASITPTLTPVPTDTPTLTLTPVPSDTPIPSDTPTLTLTPIPSDTPVPSDTPLPTNTPEPSSTPIPTNTPEPTATTSPEDLARAAFESVFRNRELQQFFVNDLVVTIRFPLSDLSASSARFEAETKMLDLICELKAAGLANLTYQLTGTITLVDNFGNTSQAEGVEMIIPGETVAQINCENRVFVDLPSIAERFDLHPALEN